MRTFFTLLIIILLATVTNTCNAQGLFGQRDLGGSLSRRSAAGSAVAPGTVGDGRRFMRDERSVSDFVGSVTGGDAAAGFVGGQSAVTTAISSVAGLTEEARPPINRPRIIRQSGLYAERLRLSPETQTQFTGEQSPIQLSQALQTFIQSRSVTIEVSQEGHTATVRGAVASEHDRQTTGLLVMFEPGIQKVENELTIDPTLPPIQPRRRASKSN